MPVWLNIARQVLSLVVSSWLSARFCLVGPSMAARGSLEPVSAWFESWRRTAGAQGRLFVLYLVSNIVIGIVVGSFAALHIYVIIDNAATMGTPQETAMSIGWALLLMLLFLFYVLVPTALFRASEPGASGDVFE
jgi:ABC-type dipeptide/oligopeptide/nickel transport system permease component